MKAQINLHDTEDGQVQLKFGEAPNEVDNEAAASPAVRLKRTLMAVIRVLGDKELQPGLESTIEAYWTLAEARKAEAEKKAAAAAELEDEL